jgi:hypothetical protein
VLTVLVAAVATLLLLPHCCCCCQVTAVSSLRSLAGWPSPWRMQRASWPWCSASLQVRGMLFVGLHCRTSCVAWPLCYNIFVRCLGVRS